MRYTYYHIEGDVVGMIHCDNPDALPIREELGKIKFNWKAGKVDFYLYDRKLDFWQQAWLNHQDRVTSMVVQAESVPPLVRMNHLLS